MEIVKVEIDELGYVLVWTKDGVIHPVPLTIEDVEKLKRELKEIEKNVRLRERRL
ncbi:hypothetical protein [Hydrogenivirga sp.]